MSDLDILKHQLSEEREARKNALERLNEQAVELSITHRELGILVNMMAGIPYPILQFDAEGTIQFSNPACIRQWGRDVVVGASLAAAFPFVKQLNVSDLIASDGLLQLMARKNDEYFRFVFKGDSANSKGFIYCLDVTEYERERLDLQKANQESEELLTSISSVLIGLDRSKKIIVWNKTAEKLLGIKEVDVLGKSLGECGVRWDNERVDRLVKACQEYSTFYEEKIYFKRRDGLEGTLEIVLTPVAKNHHRRAGVFILARDITDFALMRGEAKSSKDVDNFSELLASWTREIRGPIELISENLIFLERAMNSITRVIEKNVELLIENAEGRAVEKQLHELGDTIRDANVEHVLAELPLAVEDTIAMVEKVGRILRKAKDEPYEALENAIDEPDPVAP